MNNSEKPEIIGNIVDQQLGTFESTLAELSEALDRKPDDAPLDPEWLLAQLNKLDEGHPS